MSSRQHPPGIPCRGGEDCQEGDQVATEAGRQEVECSVLFALECGAAGTLVRMAWAFPARVVMTSFSFSALCMHVYCLPMTKKTLTDEVSMRGNSESGVHVCSEKHSVLGRLIQLTLLSLDVHIYFARPSFTLLPMRTFRCEVQRARTRITARWRPAAHPRANALLRYRAYTPAMVESASPAFSLIYGYSCPRWRQDYLPRRITRACLTSTTLGSLIATECSGRAIA